MNICNRHVDLTPDLPALAPFRPLIGIPAPAPVPAVESTPAAA